MSLKYRDSRGNETPVAGLNGTSGELVPSVSYYQSGTVTLTQEIAPNGYASVDVTMSEAMPDTDYVVVTKVGGGFWHTATVHVNATENLSASTFRISIGNPGTLDTIPANTLLIKWQAFKLMTDENRALDEQAIAQNTSDISDLQAVVPETASASNQLVTERGIYPKVFVSSYHSSEAVYKFTVSTSTQTHFLINVGYGGDILLGVHTRDDKITAIQLGSQNGSTSRASMPTIKVSSNGLTFYVRVGSDVPLSITQLYPAKYSNATVTMESVTSSDSGYTSASIVTIRRVIVNSDINPTLTATFAKSSGLKSGGVTITSCKQIGENLAVVSGYINKSSVLTVAAYQSNIGSLSISGKTALGSNPTSLFLWSQGQAPQCASCTWKTTGDWMAVPFGDGDATLSEDAWFNAIVRYQ